MNKFYIVENIGFDTKFKTDDEIKDLQWKSDNGLGVWSVEGKTEDERISKLFDKVQDYMGVYLTELSYCNNRPHPLDSVQVDSLRTVTRRFQISLLSFKMKYNQKELLNVSNNNQPHRHTKNRIQRVVRLDYLELCVMDR